MFIHSNDWTVNNELFSPPVGELSLFKLQQIPLVIIHINSLFWLLKGFLYNYKYNLSTCNFTTLDQLTNYTSRKGKKPPISWRKKYWKNTVFHQFVYWWLFSAQSVDLLRKIINFNADVFQVIVYFLLPDSF